MWPWDWVIAAGKAVSGISQQVYDWVTQLIASVTSWVNDAINSIWKGINSVWADVTHVWNQLVGFIDNLASSLWGGITHLWNIIQGWVLSLVNDLWSFVRWLYDWASKFIDSVWRQLVKYVNDVYQWVLREIWDPLKRLYDGILGWATQWITRIWQYIEHPELLVQLIGSFLLRMWLQYVLRFGAVFARWLVRNMMGMSGLIFDLLEHVLSSIL